MDGFIKLARCLLDKPILQNSRLIQVWIWCLLKATHKEHDQMVGKQVVKLLPGQFVTGRYAGASELKIPPSTFWDCLLWLKRNKSIDINSDNQKSLVTVVNWELYQIEMFTTDSGPTAARQPPDTNKNGKNDKNNIVPYGTIVQMFNEVCASLPKVEKITDSRKRTLTARWKQLDQNEDKLREFFQSVEESDFLTGRTKDWRADFDWIFKPANFTKIIEGNYKNRVSVVRPQQQTPRDEADERMKRMAMEYDRRNGNKTNSDVHGELPPGQ